MPTSPPTSPHHSARQRMTRTATQAFGKEKAHETRTKKSHITYDPHSLSTWGVFLMVRGTVFVDPSIWWTLAKLGMVAVGSGGLLLATVPDVGKFDPKTFREAVNFLKVFMAFMLGLYLNACLKRWWNTVSALTDLFVHVRKVLFTLVTLGVDGRISEQIESVMLLSLYLLEGEVTGQWLNGRDELQQGWDKTVGVCQAQGLMSAKQKEVLELKVHRENRSVAVWAWVGTLTQQLKGQPGMSPPMQTRVCSDCNEALEQMKKIKTFATLQLPYMYSHMLALLVQVNNIMLAVVCGFSCAVEVGDVIHHANLVYTGVPHARGLHMAAIYQSSQTLVIHIMSLIIEPMLYQAFLIIASTLSDPFTHPVYGLPMLEYIRDFSVQLNEMKVVGRTKPMLTTPERPRPGDNLP